MDARTIYLRKAMEFQIERSRLAASYVASLSDDELAAARYPFDSDGNRKLTGRENPRDLKPTPRRELVRLWYRIWTAAGQPGKSDALIAWESETC